MKVVKCIYKAGDHTALTIGKIYEVIKSSESNDFVIITDDYGLKSTYYIEVMTGNFSQPKFNTDGTWFVDATADIREEKLKELGI